MQPAVRRSQILEAALRAFSEGGYHGTHVSHILAEAGVARGTFYRHFASKHEVFLALIDEFFQALEGVLQRVDTHAPRSPMEQMHQNLERFVRVLFDRPELTRLMLDQGVPLEPPVQQRMRDFYADLTRMVERSLEHGRQMGIIRTLDQPVVARALVGAVKEVFYDMLHQGARFDAERLTAGLVDFAARGILTQSSS